jgi:Asp-tRNA(Asn)/Glu-tRNA(Gln) amidotransferase A subunit family amidase
LVHVIADLSQDVASAIRLAAPAARNTSPFNAHGIPSISVPCGFTSTGLPIGVQNPGAKGSDAIVLRVGAAYERAAGWNLGPPLHA